MGRARAGDGCKVGGKKNECDAAKPNELEERIITFGIQSSDRLDRRERRQVDAKSRLFFRIAIAMHMENTAVEKSAKEDPMERVNQSRKSTDIK